MWLASKGWEMMTATKIKRGAFVLSRLLVWFPTPPQYYTATPFDMEIVRENFQRELPYIKEAIEECEFIAIDAEFSGTGSRKRI